MSVSSRRNKISGAETAVSKLVRNTGNIVDISSSSCCAGGNKRGLSKENNNQISGHNDKRRKSVLCKEKRNLKSVLLSFDFCN